MDALAGVTIVCWLMGTIPVPELHEGRLRMLWEKLVDTPVRGVVYEGALAEGEQVARTPRRPGRSRSRCSTPTRSTTTPGCARRGAVDRLLVSLDRASRSRRIRAVAPQIRWPPTS